MILSKREATAGLLSGQEGDLLPSARETVPSLSATPSRLMTWTAPSSFSVGGRRFGTRHSHGVVSVGLDLELIPGVGGEAVTWAPRP